MQHNRPLGPGNLPLVVGKLGRELSIEQGREAARLTGLCCLATLRTYLGTLDPVVRVVRVLGFINCAPGFNRPSDVLNGFSDLMVEVFGEAGRHTRSAIGVAELYADMPLEVEALFEVSDRPPRRLNAARAHAAEAVREGSAAAVRERRPPIGNGEAEAATARGMLQRRGGGGSNGERRSRQR